MPQNSKNCWVQIEIGPQVFMVGTTPRHVNIGGETGK